MRGPLQTLLFSIVFAFLSAILFLLARTLDKRISLGCALGAAAYLGLDDLVTGLPSAFPGLHLPGHWNWAGKCLSLGLSFVVIALLRLRPESVGLTVRWRNAGVGFGMLLFFIVWGACLGLLFKPGSPDAETLAFQATMPGLAEELVYRGILPVLLLWHTASAESSERVPWVIIFATAAVFGLWHGLRLSGAHVGFDVMSALFPFLGSILGGWLRFKTRSLLFPVAGHGLANVAFHIAGGIHG